MAAKGRLCYELLLLMFVVQVCQTAPATNAHRRRRRFTAMLRDGFCGKPPASSKVGVDCELEALLQSQCLFDTDCEGVQKCCPHVDCIDMYICAEPLTPYDLGFPFFRPGRCYNMDELTKKLKGKCTKEASCKHDLDCPSPEEKCCFVDLSCGFRRQCFRSIPNCNVRGMTYGVGQVYYRDNGCITCTCALSKIGPAMECVEEFCINGVPIDTYMHLIFGPDEYFNRISHEEGMVVVAGVAGMNIGIEQEHQQR
ncbi:uncharacterized protein LOC117104065 [Anneissia japonica]|uniref:uncharacterized protein LOC117104065 n=1 Tax=Anneissia japonica TaxID=1529436 RepID=UPI0014255616|nr:uncharacterized protein LOC117104065 [Anneissia japonica]